DFHFQSVIPLAGPDQEVFAVAQVLDPQSGHADFRFVHRLPPVQWAGCRGVSFEIVNKPKVRSGDSSLNAYAIVRELTLGIYGQSLTRRAWARSFRKDFSPLRYTIRNRKTNQSFRKDPRPCSNPK